jgi:hypothetical protein
VGHYRELAAWDSSTVQAREARWESRLPVMVVSASETLKIPGAEALQQELVKLSSCGSRQVAAGATHMSIVTNRDYSQKVVQAVRDILAHVKLLPRKTKIYRLLIQSGEYRRET